MYARWMLVGALAFGLGGAVFGFAWVALEIPFLMALQWSVGAGVLGLMAGGSRLALREAIVAGIAYLVAFTLFLFIALTVWEGPFPTAFAAAVAGLAAGALVARWPGAWRVALAAFVGFVVADLALAGVSALQPASAANPGAVQNAWFALGQAVAGVIGGAAVGAGFAWATRIREQERATST